MKVTMTKRKAKVPDNAIYRGLKIRLFPNKKQEKDMFAAINACRFVYNYMIDVHKDDYEFGRLYKDEFDMNKLIPAMRDEFPWLNHVDSTILKRVCGDLDNAYTRFFNGTGNYPIYKTKKHSKTAFPIRTERLYFVKGHAVVNWFGKMKCQGSKRCCMKEFEVKPYSGENIYRHKFYNGRITYKNGKWLLTFQIIVNGENQVKFNPKLTKDYQGIDLGLTDLAIVAHGNKGYRVPNINKTKRMRQLERKIKHLHRNICRKHKQNGADSYGKKSNNIHKELKALRKLYAKRTNIRQDHIHQVTHILTRHLLPCRVVMENPYIEGLLKNKNISKSLSDQKWHEFIRQMRYKCEDLGIEFVQVDRFYPSSKLCSSCGSVNENLKLRNRKYRCVNPGCAYHYNPIDRDLNAARNLMNYGRPVVSL